jgi:3-dehydrotetronate 4-kinase
MSIKLGCIADDFTGATDLANNLVRSGMKTVQTIGIPDSLEPVQADAIVVALKSRTIAPGDAIAQSLAALKWLQQQGATQIYFKYCSTFDSTTQGNIGPVTEALMAAIGTDFTIATPAFPDNKRTVFKGYLFAGDVLLNESGMQNHPLTPMTDANLVRVMQAQCTSKVGLIDHSVVAKGAAAITERIRTLKTSGVAVAIVDAMSNQDLITMGPAFKSLSLITAGSGVAIGLPQNFGISPNNLASQLSKPNGHRAIVSGSCSVATNTQVKNFIDKGGSAFEVNPLHLSQGQNVVSQALGWAKPLLSCKPVLIYSTAAPDDIKAVQASLGIERAGTMVENALAGIAEQLVAAGVGELIVAGGETSGACVQALNIRRLQIGPQIDPGVPWCFAPSAKGRASGLHLTLKSGNFGTDDFFTKAFL